MRIFVISLVLWGYLSRLVMGQPASTFCDCSATERTAAEMFQQGQLTQLETFLQQWKQRSLREKPSYASTPQWIRVHYLGGVAALQRHAPAQAIAWLKAVVASPSPLHTQVTFVLGKAYLQNKQISQALRYLRRAIPLLQGHHKKQAFRLLLQACQQAQQWGEIENITRRLLVSWRNPSEQIWLRAMRLQALQHTEQWKSWMSEARHLIFLFPGDPTVRTIWKLAMQMDRQKRGIWYPWSLQEQQQILLRLTQTHPQQALQQSQQWWKTWPPHLQKQRSIQYHQWFVKGLAWFELRQYNKALVVLQRLLSARDAPGDMRHKAVKLLGRIYPLTGRYAEGERNILRDGTRGLGYHTTGLSFYLAAWMAMVQGAYARAYQHFDVYHKRYPKASTIRRYWRARWFQAWCLFRMGQYEQAIRSFQLVHQQARRYILHDQGWYWMARCYEKWGRQQEAYRMYALVIRYYPLEYYGILAQQRLSRWYAHLSPARKKQLALDAPKHSPTHISLRLWHPNWKRLPTQQHVRYLVHAPLLTETTPVWPPALSETIQKQAQQNMTSSWLPPLPPYCRHNRSAICRTAQEICWLSCISQGRDAADAFYPQQATWLTSLPKRQQSILWFHHVQAHTYGIEMARIQQSSPYMSGVPSVSTLNAHFPMAYPGFLFRYAHQFRIAPSLGWSIMREESLFQERGRSNAGAYGLMQILPATGYEIAQQLRLKKYRTELLSRPSWNIRMGCWYLSYLAQLYKGHIFLIAASYNAGPHYVDAWLRGREHLAPDEFVEEIFLTETRHYVKRILRSYAIYKLLLFRKWTPAVPPIPSITSLRQIPTAP